MMRLKTRLWTMSGAFLFLALAVKADEMSARLPTVQIIQSINVSEESQEDELPMGAVIWDPYAMPEAARSTLLFSIPAEALEHLEHNQDQDGHPLF